MTMIKRRIFINYEKEEKWLNEMAQKGYHLVKYSLTKYTFEEGEAGKYIYRIQYVGNNTDEENEEYFQIMKDSNVELITYAMNWAIFVKKQKMDHSIFFQITRQKFNIIIQSVKCLAS